MLMNSNKDEAKLIFVGYVDHLLIQLVDAYTFQDANLGPHWAETFWHCK